MVPEVDGSAVMGARQPQGEDVGAVPAGDLDDNARRVGPPDDEAVHPPTIDLQEGHSLVAEVWDLFLLPGAVHQI